MGRGARKASQPRLPSPPTVVDYKPDATRPLPQIHQLVTTPAGGFECAATANLLVRVTPTSDPQRAHLLSARVCSCRADDCDARIAVTVAIRHGFAGFVPLNPTERRWAPRVYQAIPDVGADGRAIVRADAWGDGVEVLLERANTVTRHLRTPTSCSCMQPECEAMAWLRLAVDAGLHPFVPQGPAYDLITDEPWTWTAPYGVAPRLGPAVIYGSRLSASEVAITEAGGLRSARYRVSRHGCDCGRPADCLHRQLARLLIEART